MRFLVFHRVSPSVKRRQLDRDQLVMRLIEIIPVIFSVGGGAERRYNRSRCPYSDESIHCEEALNYFPVINSHHEIRGTYHSFSLPWLAHYEFSASGDVFILQCYRHFRYPLSVRRNYRHYHGIIEVPV